MAQTSREITFEEWVVWVFDHPVTDPAWHWEYEGEQWDNDSTNVVSYMTRLFEDPVQYLKGYSDEQLNQGFWFMVSSDCSNHVFALLDENVSRTARCRCIRSIVTLFERLFAQRCSPHPSHLDEPGVNPLNSVCYMWWDLLRFLGEPDNPSRTETDREFLEVMRRTLELPHDACRESALHGLGHWQMYYPKVVENIIDGFLARNPSIRLELRAYAMDARRGGIL